jgi:chemotaxis protein MotB
MSSRRKHAAHEEEHENHERWLVTYADMITLLMVLFIVLFAMSTVDQKKFNALKSGLAAGFGQSTSVLDGSSSILDEPGTAVAAPINPNKIQDNPEVEEIKSTAVTAALAKQQQAEYAEASQEADRLTGIEKRLMDALRKKGLESDVQTKVDGRGLTVSLVSRHVVFANNLATFTARGREIVRTLAPILRDLPDKLAIEGHTNQVKVKPKYFASDWDLSAARAITVLRYLSEDEGIPAKRLSAVGYGHVKPLVDPAQPRSQELNKRVDIVVLSGLLDQGKETLSRVVYDREHDGVPKDEPTGGALKAGGKPGEPGKADQPGKHSTDHSTTASTQAGHTEESH